MSGSQDSETHFKIEYQYTVPPFKIIAINWLGVYDHRQLDYLLKSLFRQTTKDTSKLHVTDPLWGTSIGNIDFTHNGQAMQKEFRWFDLIM